MGIDLFSVYYNILSYFTMAFSKKKFVKFGKVEMLKKYWKLERRKFALPQKSEELRQTWYVCF